LVIKRRVEVWGRLDFGEYKLEGRKFQAEDRRKLQIYVFVFALKLLMRKSGGGISRRTGIFELETRSNYQEIK